MPKLFMFRPQDEQPFIGGHPCLNPAKFPQSFQANDQARRDEDARRQAEADAQRAANVQAEAARKAESEAHATYRRAAEQALQDIQFGFDQASLTETAKHDLQGVADFLEQYPKARLQIEGHCDERGTNEYNLGLGERRAQAVLDYLKGLGGREEQLSTISYGKEKPLCTQAEEACWSRNRRAHFALQ